MLRRLRFLLALLIGGLITFYFLDFAGWSNGWPNLARIQLVPAVLAGSVVVLAVLLLLTILFGRIYCSVICPMGIFQDVVGWLSRKINRKKRYHYSPEMRVLRYGLLGGVVVAFLGGITVLLSLVEPYSAFGRMAVNVFRPVYMVLNNLLASVFNSFGNYTFYHTDVYVLNAAALTLGLVTFGVIAFLSWCNGRTWCNTVCPVGTVLGFLSRYSLLKVQIDPDVCVSCGLCERKCKASCIDSRTKQIDHSRCVNCYNCLSVCHQQGIGYRLSWKKKRKKAEKSDDSRRRFMTALTALTLTIPRKAVAQGTALAGGNKPWQKKHPLSPPGSHSADHLLKYCTACHLCIAKCPSHVLKPAFMDYGWGGMMQPKMDFEHGFCNFDCTVCAEVCPNGALLPLTKEEKHQLQPGRVVFVRENCIVNTDGTSCGACSEHCPTQAVTMVAYKNGLTIPSVNPDICVGCGGCEYVCPVRPYRAIYIEGNPVHQQAKAFREAERKEFVPEGFGF